MRKMKFFGVLLTLFLFIGTSIGLSAAIGEVTITVTHNVSTVDESQTSLKATHGSLLSITAPEIKEEQVFKYWVVNGILRQDYAREQSIIVKASLDLKAVYGHPTDHIVTFIDSNGAYIKHNLVSEGGSVTPPASPNKPQATFTGWEALGSSIPISNITGDVVYVATYTTSTNAGSLTVDGTLQPQKTINDVVELTLPTGKTHWVDGEGNILSYEETYQFTMLVEDRVVNSVAGGTKQPVVNMVAESNLREGHTSYVGQFDSNGLNVIEYGFIISRSKDILTLDSLGATIIPSNTYNSETNEFLRSFAEDTYNSIRAYAIFKDIDTQVVKYSDNMVGNPKITEYISYQTGFEDGTNENNYTPIIREKISNGLTWELYQGNIVSSGSPLNGTFNAMFRISASNAGPAYMQMKSEHSSNISRIKFSTSMANQSEATGNLNIYYKIGSGDWINYETKNPGISKTDYDITFENISGITNIKFEFSYSNAVSSNRDSRIDDIIVYSKDEVEHEIVFNNEGDKTIQFIEDGASIVYIPTKLGYSFDGWFLDEEQTLPFTGLVNQSITLYAKFSPIPTYTVSFDLNGGTGEVSSQAVNQGEFASAPTDEISNGYLLFDGWYTAASGGTKFIFNTMAITNDITLYAQWTPTPTISQVLATSNGTESTFIGTVTGITTNKIMVEDTTGAITLYYNPTAPAGLSIGDKYVIKGTRAVYNGLNQMTGATLELVSKDNDLIAPTDIINLADLVVSYQAKRINLSGIVNSISATGQELSVTVGSATIIVRSASNLISDPINAHILTGIVGQGVELVGIHVDWFNGAQLLPTHTTQIIFTELTDAEKVAADKAALILPASVSEDLVLPAAGSVHGSAITWVSGTPAIIGNNGAVVLLPEVDTNVTFTATITNGEVTDTKEIIVKVLAEGTVPQAPITITLTESGIWGVKTNSYAEGNFEKEFSGMTIKSTESGFYTGSNYGDNKIQVRKNTGWIYNTDIPVGYKIKSITVTGKTAGTVNIYFSTTTSKPDTNVVSAVLTSGDVSINGYEYFYIKDNGGSGTITIDSIVIELIPNP